VFNDDLKLKTTISLARSPKDQLYYLSKLMNMTKYTQGNRNTISVDDDMKVDYFRLLCQFETEEKVLEELKAHSYPPMRVLEICKEKNAELPFAYINERLGRSIEALEVFKTRFRRNTNKLEKLLVFDTLFESSINTAFNSEDNLVPVKRVLKTKFYFDDYIEEGLVFKKHANATKEVTTILETMENESMMVKELGKNSDNAIEISYKWFKFLTTFIPYKERTIKEPKQ
jgi:hypothetical protein